MVDIGVGAAGTGVAVSLEVESCEWIVWGDSSAKLRNEWYADVLPEGVGGAVEVVGGAVEAVVKPAPSTSPSSSSSPSPSVDSLRSESPSVGKSARLVFRSIPAVAAVTVFLFGFTDLLGLIPITVRTRTGTVVVGWLCTVRDASVELLLVLLLLFVRGFRFTKEGIAVGELGGKFLLI